MLFSTFSFYRTIKSLLFRLLFVAVRIFAILHFEENPALTSLVFAISIVVFLTGGDDQILIYEDRIRIRAGTWRQGFRGSKGYWYTDIEKLEIGGAIGLKQDVGGDAIVALPGSGFPIRGWNEVSVRLKSGACINFRMSIYRGEIDEALSKIPAPFDTLVTKA